MEDDRRSSPGLKRHFVYQRDYLASSLVPGMKEQWA
jgi:hypothetical protein